MKNALTLIPIALLGVFLLLFVPNQPLAQNKDTSDPVLNHDREITSSSTNNYYLKTAKIFLGLQNYPKAIESLELAILLEPDNTEAHTLLKESRQLLEEKKTSPDILGKASIPKATTTTPPSADKDISLLIQDAYTAIREERYDDAIAISDSILRTDPINKEALYIKEKVNGIKHKRITENLKTTSAQERLKNQEYLREASIPYQDKIRFPAKEQWKDISKRTLPELDKIVEESKKKTEQLCSIPNPSTELFPKVIEDALNTIISFEFVDTPLKDVIVFIREKTNINMVIDSEAGNTPVTLKLKDVPLRTALKYALPKGHEYVIEGDIIHVYKQKMELRVYDVRDILINFDDKEPLKFDITASASLAISKAAPPKVKDPSERVLDLIEQIVTTIEPSSWSSTVNVVGIPVTATSVQRRINIPGRGEGSITARMGQPGDLVVVNSKYVHKQIEGLLASLRSSQNIQVSIEARFISVSDKFLEDIGNNFTKFLGGKESAIDTGVSAGRDTIAGDTSSSKVSGLNLHYSIFNDSMLIGFLKAVQESKGSELLTSPRITLSNTQRGNIAVVQTKNYVQSTSVSEGVVTPVIGTVPDGTTFDVRPVVSADRKYIYLEVTPSVFRIEEIQNFPFSGVGSATIASGGAGVVNIPPQQIIQLPIVNVSQISVTVCVPDKGTLMIGGLGSINKVNLTTGIPILSKIPLLKTLFSRNQKNNTKSNLIILLKPMILIREEQEANFLSLANKNINGTDSNNKNNSSRQESPPDDTIKEKDQRSFGIDQ